MKILRLSAIALAFSITAANAQNTDGQSLSSPTINRNNSGNPVVQAIPGNQLPRRRESKAIPGRGLNSEGRALTYPNGRRRGG